MGIGKSRASSARLMKDSIHNRTGFMAVQCYTVWALERANDIRAINGMCVAGLTYKSCLDHVGRTEEHFSNLWKVFDRFREHNSQSQDKTRRHATISKRSAIYRLHRLIEGSIY